MWFLHPPFYWKGFFNGPPYLCPSPCSAANVATGLFDSFLWRYPSFPKKTSSFDLWPHTLVLPLHCTHFSSLVPSFKVGVRQCLFSFILSLEGILFIPVSSTIISMSSPSTPVLTWIDRPFCAHTQTRQRLSSSVASPKCVLCLFLNLFMRFVCRGWKPHCIYQFIGSSECTFRKVSVHPIVSIPKGTF